MASRRPLPTPFESGLRGAPSHHHSASYPTPRSLLQVRRLRGRLQVQRLASGDRLLRPHRRHNHRSRHDRRVHRGVRTVPQPGACRRAAERRRATEHRAATRPRRRRLFGSLRTSEPLRTSPSHPTHLHASHPFPFRRGVRFRLPIFPRVRSRAALNTGATSHRTAFWSHHCFRFTGAKTSCTGKRARWTPTARTNLRANGRRLLPPPPRAPPLPVLLLQVDAHCSYGAACRYGACAVAEGRRRRRRRCCVTFTTTDGDPWCCGAT